MFGKKLPAAFWIGNTFVRRSNDRDSVLYASWSEPDGSTEHAYLRSNDRELRRAIAQAKCAGTFRLA